MDYDLTPRGWTPKRPNWTWVFLLLAIAMFLGAYINTATGQLDYAVDDYISVYDIREEHMYKLRMCESTNGKYMVGDGGKSNGWYQIQQPTLEYFMDRYYGRAIGTTQLDRDVYLSIVNSYEDAHFWAYYGQYELGLFEWWTCNKLI